MNVSTQILISNQTGAPRQILIFNRPFDSPPRYWSAVLDAWKIFPLDPGQSVTTAYIQNQLQIAAAITSGRGDHRTVFTEAQLGQTWRFTLDDKGNPRLGLYGAESRTTVGFMNGTHRNATVSIHNDARPLMSKPMPPNFMDHFRIEPDLYFHCTTPLNPESAEVALESEMFALNLRYDWETARILQLSPQDGGVKWMLLDLPVMAEEAEESSE